MNTKAKRLRPGGLDKLVLAYLEKHKDEGPLTASAIGKGIGRSSGGHRQLPCSAGQGEESAPSQTQAAQLRSQGGEVAMRRQAVGQKRAVSRAVQPTSVAMFKQEVADRFAENLRRCRGRSGLSQEKLRISGLAP